MPRGIKELSKREQDWDTCRIVLEGHNDSVENVAFSPDGRLVASASLESVRVWEVETGSGHLVAGRSISWSSMPTVSFSSDGQRLQTNNGDFHLDSRIMPLPSFQASRQPHIFVRDRWIYSNRRRLLWLPAEFEPHCSVAKDDTVCLGHASGRVTILKFPTV